MNGQSRERVHRLISDQKCRCTRQNCFQAFARLLEKIMQFCEIFWGLAKKFQDEYAACHTMRATMGSCVMMNNGMDCLLR